MWARAGNTPFQWGKQVGSDLGGTRNPMVVHWPARIAETGGLRSQFTHVIDVAPKILDVADIPVPETVDGIEQQPMHGTSFVASLTWLHCTCAFHARKFPVTTDISFKVMAAAGVAQCANVSRCVIGLTVVSR
jgi:arylsulfatase A-like enzyme